MGKTHKILTGTVIGVASAGLITAGLCVPVLNNLIRPILGEMGANSIANTILDLGKNKIHNLLQQQPGNFVKNANIQKLVVQSIKSAFDYIETEYIRTKGRKEAKQQISILKKILTENQRKIQSEIDDNYYLNCTEIKHITDYFVEKYLNLGGYPDFVEFFKLRFPDVLQSCFGNSFKGNKEAIEEFQHFCVAEILQEVKKLKNQQQNKLSEQDSNKIDELINLLNNPQKINTAIDSAISNTLASIDKKLTTVGVNVEQILEEITKKKRYERLLMILLSVALGLLFAAFCVIEYVRLNQPFTATIIVKDWKGDVFDEPVKLSIQLDDKIEQTPINTNGEAVFKGIASKFNKSKVKIAVLHEGSDNGYYLQENTVFISKNDVSETRVMLRGIDCLKGTIVDENGIGIATAEVFVGDIMGKTDPNGHFSINIPIEKQRRTQNIEIIKDGYKPYHYIEMTMAGDNEAEIILQKLK